MLYYIAINGYISVVGSADGNIKEISQTKYDEIEYLLANKPKSDNPEYDYRLKEDLEWELFKIDTTPRDDSTAEELLNILTGESE